MYLIIRYVLRSPPCLFPEPEPTNIDDEFGHPTVAPRITYIRWKTFATGAYSVELPTNRRDESRIPGNPELAVFFLPFSQSRHEHSLTCTVQLCIFARRQARLTRQVQRSPWSRSRITFDSSLARNIAAIMVFLHHIITSYVKDVKQSQLYLERLLGIGQSSSPVCCIVHMYFHRLLRAPGISKVRSTYICICSCRSTSRGAGTGQIQPDLGFA